MDTDFLSCCVSLDVSSTVVGGASSLDFFAIGGVLGGVMGGVLGGVGLNFDVVSCASSTGSTAEVFVVSEDLNNVQHHFVNTFHEVNMFPEKFIEI